MVLKWFVRFNEELWNQGMVPGNGIEPSRYFYRGILSPLRLPISPPGLFAGSCFLRSAYSASVVARAHACTHDSFLVSANLKNHESSKNPSSFETRSSTGVHSRVISLSLIISLCQRLSKVPCCCLMLPWGQHILRLLLFEHMRAFVSYLLFIANFMNP